MSNSRPSLHRDNEDPKSKSRVTNTKRESSKVRVEKKSASKSELASYYGPKRESKAIAATAVNPTTGSRSVIKGGTETDISSKLSKYTNRNKDSTKMSASSSKMMDSIYSPQKTVKSHGNKPSRSGIVLDSVGTKKLVIPETNPKAHMDDSVSLHSSRAQKLSHNRSTARHSEASDKINIGGPVKRPLIKQNTITLESSNKGVHEADEDKSYSYEDDFEDYESDFENSTGSDKDKSSDISDEDYDEPKKEVVPRTTVNESSKLHSMASVPDNARATYTVAPENTSTATKEEERTQQETRINSPMKLVPKSVSALPATIENQAPQVFINFTKSKQSLSAQKARKRGNKLLELITLDSVSFNLFSKSPAAYSEFMESFGNINAKQACVQTGEDSIQEESQTDAIEMLDLWTQYPPHMCGAIGGQYVAQHEKSVEIHGVKDWKRLNKFVKESGRVMCTLLEEEKIVSDEDRLANESKAKLKFTERVVALQQPQLAIDRPVISVCYSGNQVNLLLAIYGSPKMDNNRDDLGDKGIICVWNIFQPTRPQDVLICSSKSVCCCFGGSSDFVFAGMEDGSVATWDLREPCCSHRSEIVDNIDWTLRCPTYSTAEVMGDEGHHSPIVSILCNQNDNNKFGDKGDRGITQVATLEEQACIHIWILTNVTSTETEASSSTDLGLRPTGCIKLIKSATIDLKTMSSLQSFMENGGRVLDFSCSHLDESTFYVTTDTSYIIRCATNNSKPKVYLETQENILEVTSICYNPFKDFNLFLTGNSDGNLNLFSTTKEMPIMTWACSTNPSTIRKVLWSNSSPNIFYCLDGDGQIHLWDLTESNSRPVISTALIKQKIDCFTLSYDGRHNSDPSTKLHPNLAIGYNNGIIEVHFLTQKYSRNNPEDRQMFKKYLEML